MLTEHTIETCDCPTCRERRAYERGAEAERARVRLLIGKDRVEAHGVTVMSNDTIAALLGGEGGT